MTTKFENNCTQNTPNHSSCHSKFKSTKQRDLTVIGKAEIEMEETPMNPIASPAFSTWTIGTTEGGKSSLRNISENNKAVIEKQLNSNKVDIDSGESAQFRTGINAIDYIPTLSSLSNMGQKGTKCNQKRTDCESLYENRLLHQPSTDVETVLAASCECLHFDIAEVWLRTGMKSHQLINSHLRPTALENSVRNELVDVYYGERSSERTHRLSPALCKRAKEAQDVVWVTTHSEIGAETLKVSISDVRTAVAIPVCHEASNTNITFIFFSMKRKTMNLSAVEYLVHMSLSAAVVATSPIDFYSDRRIRSNLSQTTCSPTHDIKLKKESVTGADLNLKWNVLKNVEYLTDGGNSWIHTAVMKGKSVVVKTLKPECQDVALAINEIEDELAIHSKLNHTNIVSLHGAGLTSTGVRFIVLERLDGGTLSQMLGYDSRVRDRRRRFWRKRHHSYRECLNHARSLAIALDYCHTDAIPGGMLLHRDLKPDNIGFTLDGTLKLIDFGLATIIKNSNPTRDDVYEMSGETGSLRYMAPEVADARPYNHKADVYSFGVILWELLAMKRPYDRMTRESFYERVVAGGERPVISKKWPLEISRLIESCWSSNIEERPTFSDIVNSLDVIISRENKTGVKKKIVSLIDRHSTWF